MMEGSGARVTTRSELPNSLYGSRKDETPQKWLTLPHFCDRYAVITASGAIASV